MCTFAPYFSFLYSYYVHLFFNVCCASLGMLPCYSCCWMFNQLCMRMLFLQCLLFYWFIVFGCVQLMLSLSPPDECLHCQKLATNKYFLTTYATAGQWLWRTVLRPAFKNLIKICFLFICHWCLQSMFIHICFLYCIHISL